MARLTGPPVELEDIKDVREFARWRARAALGANGNLTDIQRDDACDEALVLIYALHERWDPKRCERFSAFLMTYLDRALISWWRMELRQSGRGSWNGSTGSYRYFGSVSLDSMDDDTSFEDGVAGGEPNRIVDRALIAHGPGE